MRLAAGIVLALILGGCAQPEQGRALRLAYRAASSHHFHYESEMAGTERTADGSQRRDDVQHTADAVWRVVSVDRGGAVTIEQTVSDGGGWRFALAPGGLVAAAPAPGTFTVPGSSQFLAILPDRPVRVGDGWTSDVRLPGRTTLRAESRLDRYERWRGRDVAVVTSRSTGPFDVAAGAARSRGTVDGRSTTWLDPASGLVVKVDHTFTTTFTTGQPPVGFTGTYRLRLESTDP
jgi:hypothetical protein